MGCSSSGRHLLEIGSLKDSCLIRYFFDEKYCMQKSVCLQKKHLTAKKAFDCKKSICLQKKHLRAFFCAPAILSKADVKAQRALI
jgi:hypothetical protein